MGLFQRIRHIDLQPVIGREVVGPLLALRRRQVVAGELQAQLQVRHGIGRHQQLEAEEPRQQVVAHVAGPHPGVAGAGELLADVVDDGVEEGAGAGGRVENQHPVHLVGLAHQVLPALDPFARVAVGDGDLRRVGQAVRQLEGISQDVIDGAHNVADHRLRRVVDPARLTQRGVIGGQEGLVEMDDRVFLAGAPAEVGEDCAHVGLPQELHQVVDEAGEWLVVQVGSGYLIEELAQERIGLRDERLGFLAGEAGRDVHGPRREEAIGDGLGKHVGEVPRLEVGDEGLAKGVEPPGKGRRCAPTLDRVDDDLTDQMGQAGHPLGQIFRRRDWFGPAGQEIVEERGHGVAAGFVVAQLAAAPDPGQAGGLPGLPLDVPAKLQVISQDQVVEGPAVAAELFGAFGFVEGATDVLGFDVADRQAGARHREVGRAAFDPPRLVGGHDVRVQRFEQRLEGRPVGVF